MEQSYNRLTYSEATEWLFSRLPQFQRQGADAYKPGLGTTLRLSAMYGDPHTKLKAIHVGGTNGKGSAAHTLAAVLQAAGYRVGLYTSPHLVDFRERIRVNGEMIPQDEVSAFVSDFRSREPEDCAPSFFELTTVLAFRYFVRRKVDIAVIEVGLGGRLDSTNILTPLLSVITNISLDHTALLGSTEEEIAREKAGIIKPSVHVVIGESAGAVRGVFSEKAREAGARIVYADSDPLYASALRCPGAEGGFVYFSTPWGDIKGELAGDYQKKNTNTVLHCLSILRKLGWKITPPAVAKGFGNVTGLTGLMGRWTLLSREPLAICDTGHNIGGWRYIAGRLGAIPGKKRIVIGFVSDKDVSAILSLLRDEVRDTEIIFTAADLPRAMEASGLASLAAALGLEGKVVVPVGAAYAEALAGARADMEAGIESMVYVGGSTFVVGDLLRSLEKPGD